MKKNIKEIKSKIVKILKKNKLLINENKNNLLIDNILIDNKINKYVNNVTSRVMQIFADYNMINNKYLKFYEKNKKGSNGVEPNKLSSDYDIYKEQKYLNISVDIINSRAGMAEWLTQSVVIRCPSGCVGSIPTLGAAENFVEINNKTIFNTLKIWSISNKQIRLEMSVRALSGDFK